jgi:hypothetical protein
MKKFIVFLILLSGCASFQMKTPTGWEVNYYRFWDQELSNVYFDVNTNGTVQGGLGSQKSESQKMIELLLQTLAQGAK